MPFGFLRIILGALCVFFSHFLGRSFLRMTRGQERQSSAVSWTLRAVVAGGAVVWHSGFDRITITVAALALLSLAAGIYVEWKPKHHDELEKVMFPQD